MRFDSTLKNLGVDDPQAQQAYDPLLTDLQRNLTVGAFAAVTQQLYPKKISGQDKPLLGLGVPGYEIDFTFGVPVYSNTPRLLLRVPNKFRGENQQQVLEPTGQKWHGQRLGYGGAPLPENAVLVYPNQEGPQGQVEQRPIVHWSGVVPDQYVIVGRIYDLTQKKLDGILRDIFNAHGSPGNIFEEFEGRATVEDVVEILNRLKQEGYSNFYSTDQNYVDRSDAIFSGGRGSGLRSRAKDKERAAATYIPGDVRLGFAPQEEISDGGFACKIISSGADGREELRPISKVFMHENYFYDLNIPEMPGRVPVSPSKGQLLFIHGHPARGQEVHVEHFLEKLGAVNRALTPAAP